MAYFISDTHFNHKNIIRYCDRPFEDVKEMNETMITYWNKTVKPNDTVYHLGDFSLCNKSSSELIARKLNGKKILIRGNHDKRSDKWFLDIGFNKVCKKLRIGNYLLSHRPIKNLKVGLINIHGHIHNNEVQLDTRFHINVSVEIIGYKPMWINTGG